MSDKPDNPFKFWEELKRRKVVRVIIGYGAAAFVIIELINNITEPLRLPEWVPALIIVLLAIGFLIAIVMSWIFDITPEGIKKTELFKKVEQNEDPSKKTKRKLKASDAIIAVLLVAVAVLAFPRVFNKDKFEDIRDEDGRISIAVMPFNNMTNDTLLNIWQEVIQIELITKLSDSEELLVNQFQTTYDVLQGRDNTKYSSITPAVASEISRKIESKTVILGNIVKSGDIVRINTQLIDSETQETYKSFQVESNSDDILFITDSLSKLISNFLEIKVLEKDAVRMLRSTSTTSSPEVYRYYIKGLNLYMDREYSSAIDLLNQAYAEDNNFISARIMVIFAFYNLGRHDEAKYYLEETFEQIDSFSFADQLMLKYIRSYYDKDPLEGIKYTRLHLELHPEDRNLWYHQGYNYSNIHQYEEALYYLEKTLEIDEKWGRSSTWYTFYTYAGTAYHKLGNHDKESEIYELGLKSLPDNPSITRQQAVCAFSLGDTIEGKEYIDKYEALIETRGWTKNQVLNSLGNVYRLAGYFDEAEKYFLELIEKAPESILGLRSITYLYIIDEFSIDEGMKLIERALDIYPDNYSFLYRKGWGFYKQGKLEEGLGLLEKSWGLRPIYNHDHFLSIQEVKQALAKQKTDAAPQLSLLTPPLKGVGGCKIWITSFHSVIPNGGP